MPAAVAIPLITTAVSTGASIYQSSSANKKAKSAMKDIEDYKRQEITNPYDGLQVSTLGADRQREDLGRTMASYGTLAAMGGTRAISSLLPNLIAQQNAQEAQIVGNLDQQEAQRQQLIAQGNSMVQQMTEQRENNDLLGMGNQLSIYEQQKAQGQNNLMQGLIQGGASIAGGVIGSGYNPFTSKPLESIPMGSPASLNINSPMNGIDLNKGMEGAFTSTQQLPTNLAGLNMAKINRPMNYEQLHYGMNGAFGSSPKLFWN